MTGAMRPGVSAEAIAASLRGIGMMIPMAVRDHAGIVECLKMRCEELEYARWLRPLAGGEHHLSSGDVPGRQCDFCERSS
jgi:hypothetical protein